MKFSRELNLNKMLENLILEISVSVLIHSIILVIYIIYERIEFTEILLLKFIILLGFGLWLINFFIFIQSTLKNALC